MQKQFAQGRHTVSLHSFGQKIFADASSKGTQPLMSTALLKDQSKKPFYKDDLKSFFYVLIYMDTMYVGPNNWQRNVETVPKFIHEWFDMKGMEELVCKKDGMLDNKYKDFEKYYLSHFTPYFEFLKPCIRSMHAALRAPRKRHVTHAC